jgi:hypothetical protein
MASPVQSVEVGMVVQARRGRGRQWRVAGIGRAGRWNLMPIGGDVGRFGGVKPISRTEDELREGWVRV